MAREVASDLNGDGKMDGEDLFGMSTEALTMVVLRSCGSFITRKNTDDLPDLVLNTDKTAAIIEKIVPMFRDKFFALYSGDFSSGYTNVFSQFITPMFINDQLLFINNWLVVALELRIMESDFGILPPAKFDISQEEYIVPSSESWATYAIVPITNIDLEFTGYIMDALGYYGQQEVTRSLIDRTITSKTLRDMNTEEMLEIIFANRKYNLVQIPHHCPALHGEIAHSRRSLPTEGAQVITAETFPPP